MLLDTEFQYRIEPSWPRPVDAPPALLFASMINASMALSELRAKATEIAIWSNIQRAAALQSVQGDDTRTAVVDADGNELAAVIQVREGYTLRYDVEQYAPRSFVTF